MLEARLLGRFDVRIDGAAVQIPSRPAQSLFAYLLLNAGTAHRRERLAGLLWPESSEESARSNLRHALWRIRRSLEAAGAVDGPRADDLTVTFDAESTSWIDVVVLQEDQVGAGADALRRRVEVYRGELLPGFHDEWVVLERERVKAAFERTIQRLLDQLTQDERWPDVRTWAEHWIAVGESPEPAYRALMTSAAALGDASAVASAYRRCLTALKADLGVDPSPQTQELYEQLAKGRPSARASSRAALVTVVDADRQSAPMPGDPPYKGLHYFDESDAARFFGREELVARIVARVRERRFVAVIGASGSGKSSLVRAGVVPSFLGSLVHDGSDASVLTPTARPLEALAIALTRRQSAAGGTASLVDELAGDARTLRLTVATANHPKSEFLLVVDQFEEIFTECDDEDERRAFIENVVAAGERDGPATVIVTLRADFYGQCARYAGLRELLAAEQEYIGPMIAPELRRAIEEPARKGGWEFEPGLVDLILRDVGDEPGALPLLSHALLETWQRRSGRTMTLRSYAESGGVQGAIARTAESVYNQRLTADEREVAKVIFLRLASFGDGAQSTRRRVARRELVRSRESGSSVERVLRILADARLVSVGADSVEVAHEALFREWPALRQWLSEDREGLRIHGHLSAAAQEWDGTGHEMTELYRGARLGQALEWSGAHGERLNELEREFLDASADEAARQTAEREEGQRRELEAARRAAEAERRQAVEQRRFALEMRTRAAGLAGAFVLAIVLAGIAIFFGEQARSSALTTQELARTTFSRELAASAVNQLTIDPERSVLLALQALSATYPTDGRWTPEAESALHRAVAASHLERRLVGHTNAIFGVAFSPDGKRVVTASWDGTGRVWDADTGRELMKLSHPADPRTQGGGAAFSRDGKLIATSTADNTARLWDAETGKALRVLEGHTDIVNRVVFSPDGATIATTSFDGSARLWETATGRVLRTIRHPSGGVNSLSFAPDGTRVATGGGDQLAHVWDLSTGAELLTLRGHQGNVMGLAYSADGTRIATTGGPDRTAKVWDARTGRELITLANNRGTLRAIAFSPDGASVVTGSYSGELKVWDAATGREKLHLYGHTSQVYEVAYSADGRRVASASLDGVARIWSVGEDRELLTVAVNSVSIDAVAFDRDGARFAGALSDGSARVWDTRTGRELVTLVGHRGRVYRIAWAPDDQRLVTGSSDNTAKIWDASSGRELHTLSGHGPATIEQTGSPLGVLGVAFSSDGTRVATAGADGSGRIWDAQTGRELLALRGHVVGPPFSLGGDQSWNLESVAFSPDGKRLVTIGVNDAAVLWDVASGQRLQTFEGTGTRYSAAFSPDGVRLVTSGTQVAVWDAATGGKVFAVAAHNAQIRTVVYSRDGTRFATSANDGYVRLWDANDGRPVLQVGDGITAFSGVALNADGSVIAASAGDGTVRLYLTRIDDLIDLARSRVTRALTPEECRDFLHRSSCP